MSNLTKILLLAFIGGAIGYVTNVIAIKLLFRPINPIRIPIINKEIMGLIPKRKTEIAINIGEIIEKELLSADEIINSMITNNDKEEVVSYIKVKIKMIIDEKMAFIPTPFKSLVQGFISDNIEVEIRESIDELSKDIIKKANERIDIKEMVKTKIEELDLYELEKIIISIAQKELKHIEILGFILGFIIGIVQGVIIIFL